jgi:hypothetical protein
MVLLGMARFLLKIFLLYAVFDFKEWIAWPLHLLLKMQPGVNNKINYTFD